MADEVIRLKAAFDSEEARADIRALGQELGLLPRRVGPGVKVINKDMLTLSETVKDLGKGLQSAFPVLARLAGPGGVIAAAAYVTYQAAKAVTDLGKSFVQLKYTSKEIGLTTQELRGLITAGERAGIAPEAMTQALQTFKRNTDDFKMRTGELRNELASMGHSDLVERIAKAGTTLEAFKEALDFSKAAEEAGRPEIGRIIMEKLTGNAQLARDVYKTLAADIASTPLITDKEMEDAAKYDKIMIDLGKAWDHLKQKFVLGLFDPGRWEEEKKRWESWSAQPADAPPQSGVDTREFGTAIPGFQAGGVMGHTGLALLHAGETVIPPGGDILKGSDDTLTRAETKGTFDALVQFASYQEAIKQAGGAGAGAGGAGGGMGGGSLTGGAPAGGQVPGAEVKAAETPQATAGADLPKGMPLTPGVPGTVPGTGEGPIKGLPQVPGVPGTTPGQMPAGPTVPPGSGPTAGGGGKAAGDLSKLKGVDPRLLDVTQAAAQYLPPGYTIKPTSGVRPGDSGAHGRGLATDWQIYGPDGKPIPNKGADTTGLYRRWARGVYTEAIRKYGKDFAGKLGYGGAFGTQKGGGGVPDLMHMDLWGPRGRMDPSMILGSKNMQPFSDAEREAMLKPAPTARIDGANDSQAQAPTPKATVDLSIKNDGTAGKGLAERGKDLFQPSKVVNHQQMQHTEAGGIGHQ
jgi:hypothetical protein